MSRKSRYRKGIESVNSEKSFDRQKVSYSRHLNPEGRKDGYTQTDSIKVDNNLDTTNNAGFLSTMINFITSFFN